ncbi:MAG TPA: hypothetical protein VF275_05885 [Gammaproteobacteria bacterium]
MKSVSHIILATLLGTGTAMAAERINFDQHDANGDGYLSKSEWTNVGKINVGFEQLDRNSDQMLDKQEIRDSQLKLQQSGNMQRASSQGQSNTQSSQDGKQAFQQADKNSDGRISQDEAGNAGYDYVVIYYDPMDADGNGYLDENEWDLNETGAGIYDDGVSNISYANDSFDTYDANDDGFLDENEVAEDDYLEANFDTWDIDDDGFVTEDEADTGWFDDNDDGVFDDDDW